MSQNILDALGNIIGTIDLGDVTQAQYDSQLATYALPSVPKPTSGLSLSTYVAASQSQTTTSSSTPSTVGSMTHTPPPGVYAAQFSGNVYTDGASAQGEFGIYLNGTLIPETRRDIKCNLSLLGGLVTISLNAIGVGTNTMLEIALDGSQTIDVRFKSNNGGTIGFVERTFSLTRLR